MSASAGPTRLEHAIKTIKIRWDDAREGWNDALSSEFEVNHLAPIQMQASVTLRAMEKLGEVLAKMRRDCG